MFYIYILKDSKDRLYIGQTNDLLKRAMQHIAHSSKFEIFWT
ncbi:MAG: hypothetical protein COV31_02030 [Candidatus Yanofskybacteria bacterium CG10_big_fil_rev_8_21_14_0_10_46_23]|uniref:GIY-YIG domain-containing protein n=1 Tax=Candidatus Yanofskybacteria bacterium CG10_big_fil_rev_8_21_14_0_10_46_23 TaxID=1975098 RepID=A0A2H0R3R1_9BACT|nr:MAG: hypothetical protein COV31_02030 [Candidatus Yanofskybacteria bacterium CG10_big_fil_rev_8_21_14_0_10_46_23]